jgi:hypothetical protein
MRVKQIRVLVILFLASLAFAAPQASQNRASTRSPHGTFNVACQSCHTSMSWKPVRAVPDFDHSKTPYPLRGMHAKVACTQCHVKLVFTDVGQKCADCHADIHRGQMGAKCETCHSVKGWQVSIKDIQQHQNRFPLIGAHSTLTCETCHKGAASGQFVGLSTSCYSCHSGDYARTSNPNHASIGYTTDCQQCHTLDSWMGAKFDHAKFTGFALTGAHARLECAACHANNNFSSARSNCVSCHLTDFNGTKNPNHQTAGFSRECSTCHSTTSWLDAKFDHNTMTKFPLTGAHVNTQCTQCHSSGQFAGLSTQCVSCHLSNFQQTTNPNHASAGIPQTCVQCHNTTTWGDGKFDHSKTVFPLTGAHTTVQCTQCHVGGNYVGTPTQCSACHLATFQKTTNPNHVTGGFPQTCEQCHTTATWLTSTFNHNTTVFPLTGAHMTVACTQCHVGGKFAGTATQCSACHLTTFQQTTNPNHVAAGFPTDCSVCHSTTNWLGASFEHSKTAFPLTGAHIPLTCSACHANGVFVGLSTTCVACHLPNFQKTTNPNHVTSGFPTDCQVCHNTAAWVPSVFDHSKTVFPLTGAHTTVACSNCHVGGRYAGTPTDCYTCHKSQYTGTTSPNHVAAAFPTTCQTCHNTTAWTGAKFNHTWFPIYSGTHAGKWTTCADCHTNSSDYSSFSCITCHTHNKTSTDSNHGGVRGYAYTPTACYSCHRS